MYVSIYMQFNNINNFRKVLSCMKRESNRNSDWKVDIYISQDRGETWTLLDSGPYMSVMVSTRQGLTVVALKTNGNVYVNVPKKHNSNKYRMAKVKDLSSTLRPDGIGTTGITMSESGRLLFALVIMYNLPYVF